MLKSIVSLCLAVALCAVLSGAYPSSRQLLPQIPGYVPVYIQQGDTPLEEINLDLAEAFHAIPSGRSASGKDSISAQSDDDNIAAELPSENEDTEKVASEKKQELPYVPVYIPVNNEEAITGIDNSLNNNIKPDPDNTPILANPTN